MTIAALRALLEEEQPHVLRHPAPWIPHTAHRHVENTMSTPVPGPPPQAPAPAAPSAAPPPLPVGQLLAWAAAHPEKSLRDQADTARTALDELRARHQGALELQRIETEAEQLEERLAVLRARQAELAPPPKKTRRPRDYDAGVVRAWARERDMAVPDRGQLPAAVLAAWRRAHAA